jgi:hypothetical protein
MKQLITLLFLSIVYINNCEAKCLSKSVDTTILQQMVDSVNYLLMNSADGSVQNKLSVDMNGKMSLLDKNQSGFRFNLFQLKRSVANGKEKGIEFIPEVVGSITTNKFIYFNTNEDTVGLIKFTQTSEESVKKIHAMLLRIRDYIFEKAR